LFLEQFGFKSHALVNFVGGGGKTILILKLMDEYYSQGPVLYTTTTRIHPPDPREGLAVIASDNLPFLKTVLEQVARSSASRFSKLVVTRSFMSPTLLRGLPPDFGDALDRRLFAILLNEADGAAGYSIKLPKENEPVLMKGAEYMVPVIGIDCLYRPMGPDVLFRWQAFAERFSLRAGERLTPELASDILMHKNGVCRDWRPGMTIMPFINKVDGPTQDHAARDLADLILRNGNFPVERVVLGSVYRSRAESVTTPQA
jgi:probable selenium-dependent hydroxylase accessory protein YqeC